MTPEEEQLGAKLFDEGKSEREVAAELDISPSSANRLKKRLQAKQETDPEQHDEAVLQAADEVITDEAMALLEADRDRLAGQLEAFQARAQASWSAKQTLEQERDQLLLDTGDASGVDQRLEDADRDLRKWVRGAELITPQLAEVTGRIGRLNVSRELASLRAELDAAVTVRDEVHSRSGDRQRAAVAAVRAAAEDFCAVAAEERTTADRVASLASAMTQRAMQLGEAAPAIPEPQQTGLTARVDALGPEQALVRALTQARSGDVAGVARQLGEMNGQLPTEPSAEELERWRQMTADREKQLAELRERDAAGLGGGQQDERVPVGLDHFGNPVDKFGNVFRVRAPHPMDIWRGAYSGPPAPSSYRVGESPASY